MKIKMYFIKKIIKHLLNRMGYEIISGNRIFIKNYFKTDYTKNVLISYITNPFVTGIKLNHTNSVECLQIAKIFNKLAYNIDVIDFNNETIKINYTKYDVIFGFGDPLEKSFYDCNANERTTILYGTGCHSDLQNKATLNRLCEVFHKKDAYIPKSARIVNKTWVLQKSFSSGIISLGNNFVKDTYKEHYKGSGKIISIPASFHKTYNIDLSKKNYAEAKRHFLWFGSSGSIHKGLDILLEIFKNRKNIVLHVCGANPDEEQFNEIYDEYLSKTPNIINHGFVDIKSDDFIQIMNTCGYVLFPTASEGGSPSVLTTMGNGGLIPIISEASGLDLKDFGFIFNNLRRETIESMIEKVLQLSNEEMRTRSRQSLEFTNEYHSLKNYSKKMGLAIKDILKMENKPTQQYKN